MKNKLLLLCAFILVSLNLNAKETTCYKKNWASAKTIQDALLEGGECDSKNSLSSMIKQGWRIKDIQIKNGSTGFDYTYILSDEKILESKFVNLKEEVKIPSFKTISTKISHLSNETARINIPNLKMGQSGIVQHIYENKRSVIVSNANIIESNDKYSVLLLSKFDDLVQEAIPKTSRQVQDGDTFILNYLYDASLLVAPTSQSFTVVSEKFKNHNFIHSDIFATHLKLENEPLPSKETFIKFAKFQNLGTLFFAVDGKVYIVDAKTFKVLYSYDIMYSRTQEQLPFYTRVSDIDKSFWNIGFTKETDYNTYYKTLLGLNND